MLARTASTPCSDLNRYMRRVLGLQGPIPGVAVSRHTMKGFLTKEGGFRKNWLERWFVLDLNHSTLTYYTDMKLSQMKGGIKLADKAVIDVCPRDGPGGRLVTAVGAQRRLSPILYEHPLTTSSPGMEEKRPVQCLFQLRFATRLGGSYILVSIIHTRNGL